MYVAVLRNYHVFRSMPGIWVGVFSCIAGILGILSQRKLQQRRQKKHAEGYRDRSPRTVEAYSAFSIICSVLDITLMAIHGYIISRLVKILNLSLGFYEPAYRLNVILLLILSIILILTAMVDFVANIVGTVAACRMIGNADQTLPSSVPLVRYQQDRQRTW